MLKLEQRLRRKEACVLDHCKSTESFFNMSYDIFSTTLVGAHAAVCHSLSSRVGAYASRVHRTTPCGIPFL